MPGHPDAPPDGGSSPTAVDRYTPVGQSQNGRHPVFPQPPPASAGTGLCQGRNSTATYLQPVGQKNSPAATTYCGGGGGTWPLPPLPDVRAGALPRETETNSRGLGRDAPITHDYEEVRGYEKQQRLPEDVSDAENHTEQFVHLPQRLVVSQSQHTSNQLEGRKCANPLYASVDKCGKQTQKCSVAKETNEGDGNKSSWKHRGSRRPRACFFRCAATTLAVMLSATALIMTLLPWFGVTIARHVLLSADKQACNVSSDDTSALEQQVAELEHAVRSLQTRVIQQEAMLNSTASKVLSRPSFTRSCRVYHVSQVNGPTSWVPHSNMNNIRETYTVISAHCNIRAGGDSIIESRPYSDGTNKTEYRCVCGGKEGAALYTCIITYWLCPDSV